ncbi:MULTISPECIES: ROK family protein [Microbacterium]|uniref:ROK family protein n=1 Tax=Microbacterium TaxID=33882 RepID=UPI001F0F1999|nr:MULTISPECIES: ROK family protein [Microbacterium]
MPAHAPAEAASRIRIGLDVGGTKTDAVALAADDSVLARVRHASGWGAEATVRGILATVAELTADPRMAGRTVASIGIGVPGQVDADGARVVHAVNLGIDRLDLAARVGGSLGVPVRVENDVKAAAAGAWHLHGGRETLAYLNVGTGIAAALIVDGAVWRGSRGAAGEVGHVSVDPAGPPCACGQRGCIEALAGGASVAARWGTAAAHPVRAVFDAAEAGDERARALRRDVVAGIAAAVRILVLTTDADTVVLGGGLTALGPRLTDDVAAALHDSAAGSEFLRSVGVAERLRVLPAGSPAAAVGAALVGTEVEVLSRG